MGGRSAAGVDLMGTTYVSSVHCPLSTTVPAAALLQSSDSPHHLLAVKRSARRTLRGGYCVLQCVDSVHHGATAGAPTAPSLLHCNDPVLTSPAAIPRLSIERPPCPAFN